MHAVDKLRLYFYPRSPYGERLYEMRHTFVSIAISIHALLTESDAAGRDEQMPCTISIHALLTESDHVLTVENLQTLLFLSTLSLRRATWMPARQRQGLRYFYPRSPYGERLVHIAEHASPGGISIHALLTESDIMPPTGQKTA